MISSACSLSSSDVGGQFKVLRIRQQFLLEIERHWPPRLFLKINVVSDIVVLSVEITVGSRS
jgi:hypothetical protein